MLCKLLVYVEGWRYITHDILNIVKESMLFKISNIWDFHSVKPIASKKFKNINIFQGTCQKRFN